MEISVTRTGRSLGGSAEGERADLRRRVLETLALTDRRGYGVPLESCCSLFYEGSAPPELVESVIAETPGVALESGLVVRTDRRDLAGLMAERQRNHSGHVPFADTVANDFVGRLVSSCAFVHAVTLTGSATSGGFDPRDDVDLNVFVRDGTKYIVYLWSLALGTVTSLRNRSKVTDEMGDLPFLPKIICINVVWEDGQVRPFRRNDKWLAFELLMHRPLYGAPYLEEVLIANPWLSAHFPQFFEPGFPREGSQEAAAFAETPRAGRSLFAFLGRHPRLLAAVEALSRFAVIGAHRVVALVRSRRPGAVAREAFVNSVKRPYSVYDIPGREEPIPEAALQARAGEEPSLG